MSHFRKSFPSRFLATSDLDEPLTATIKEVVHENLGTTEKPENKPVAVFQDDDQVKPTVLNLTRCESISEVAGSEDMDHWPGTRIQLVRGSTRYQGKRVGCIDIVAPPAEDAKEASGF